MSSSRPEQQVVKHFTHVHPLTKVDGNGEFICNGCKTYGFGKMYRCVSCDYDLHDYCATCPPTLLSFMHPQHQLQLVFRGPEQTQHNKRMCDICDESIEGLYYHCEPCGFDVHPLCTRLPQHVKHVPHPAHHLELSHGGTSNTCEVCRGEIRSWRYKCGPCRLDVHMECVTVSASAGPATRQRCFQPQPQFDHHQYNQPHFNHGYPNQPHFNHGYPNQPHYNHGYPNQGPSLQSSPSMGRRMYTVLVTLTMGVVANMIAGPAFQALAGGF